MAEWQDRRKNLVKVISVTAPDGQDPEKGFEHYLVEKDDSYELLLSLNVPMPIYYPQTSTHSAKSGKNDAR